MSGRPTLYTEEAAIEVCERLSAGESLRSICNDSDTLPHESTVRTWARDNVEGFTERYLRAHDLGLDCERDKMLEIADTPIVGVIETDKLDKDGMRYTEVQRRDMIEHRRLQVDARKWYLSKLAPKRYGDRLALEHSGEIGTRAFDDEERLAQIDAIFAAIERRVCTDVDLGGIG
jgi:hypothetical protein